MSFPKHTVLQQLRSLLKYHRSTGLHTYPHGEEIGAFLKRSECGRYKHPVEFKREAAKEAISPSPVPQKESTEVTTLKEIGDEVVRCTSCSLHHERIVATPGRGGQRVHLVIIGGWLALEKNSLDIETVFGGEEDSMLGRMLDAIQLPRDQAFITNIIKCGVSASVQPKGEHVDACCSYIHRQIVSAHPQVICTMGIVATRSLLKVSRPLSQLRGTFHEYAMDGGRSIPLMPTYHPSFLLKNPEMKKATWLDLQSIQKELAKKGR